MTLMPTINEGARTITSTTGTAVPTGRGA